MCITSKIHYSEPNTSKNVYCPFINHLKKYMNRTSHIKNNLYKPLSQLFLYNSKCYRRLEVLFRALHRNVTSLIKGWVYLVKVSHI